VRIELPGSARSQHAYALQSAPLTIDRLAAAVLRVCGTLGIERALFAGHSLGTIVCMSLVQQEPALVNGLLLYGPLLGPPDPARAGLRQRAAKARAEGMFGIADAIVQSALSTSTRESQPVTVAMVRESLMAQDPEGYARTCEALSEVQAADITQTRCPALLITGDEDPVAPAQSARAIAAKMADARVQTLARCGHWTTFERAADCRALAANFLGRLH
jgi:pimeloyl-ACP methyl ester carboxylesterase